MYNVRFLSLLGVAALLAATAGCSKTTRVSGKVTYNGKPVTGGTLTIASLNTKIAPGQIELTENGEFEDAVVPLGEAKVLVDNRALKAVDKGPFGAGSGDAKRRSNVAHGPPARPG